MMTVLQAPGHRPKCLPGSSNPPEEIKINEASTPQLLGFWLLGPGTLGCKAQLLLKSSDLGH